MFLKDTRRQLGADHDLLDFGGTITSGGTAQALLPQQPGRSYLLIQNLSDTNMTIGIGPPPCTATVSGGKVTGITAGNNGLGYTFPPSVELMGGIINGAIDSRPDISPGFKPAKAVATISAGALTGITVTDGGAGYLVAPLVKLVNGSANLGGGATLASATTGILLVPNFALIFDASFCPTSAVNIFCITSTKAFACKVAF